MSNGDSTEKTESFLTVLDAGPIIHLDELNCLDLLEGLGRKKMPAAVLDEVRKHRPELREGAIREIEIVREPASVSPKLTILKNSLSLDVGEIYALALLQELRGNLFLCDDASARLAGESLGFRVRGTIGILIRAIRRHTRTPDEIRELLEGIPSNSSLHISRLLLRRVISELR